MLIFLLIYLFIIPHASHACVKYAVENMARFFSKSVHFEILYIDRTLETENSGFFFKNSCLPLNEQKISIKEFL